MVPGVPKFAIDPEVIYLLVLPPLVYISAFFTPLARCARTIKPSPLRTATGS